MNNAFEPAFMTDHRADTAYIHESAYVDSPCHIGDYTSILHFSHVMGHSIIGKHCNIGRHVAIESGVMVGDQVRVMNNVQLNSGAILEHGVYCGSNVTFEETRHVRASNKAMSRVSPTLVRRGAQIGPNTTVAAGFIIGQFAFVEAGTIVDRNIPDFAIVYGNPLKFAGWRCECGHTLESSSSKDQFSCSYCNRQYHRQSKWKVLQLTTGETARDTHSQFNATIRTAQRFD